MNVKGLFIIFASFKSAERWVCAADTENPSDVRHLASWDGVKERFAEARDCMYGEGKGLVLLIMEVRKCGGGGGGGGEVESISSEFKRAKDKLATIVERRDELREELLKRESDIALKDKDPSEFSPTESKPLQLIESKSKEELEKIYEENEAKCRDLLQQQRIVEAQIENSQANHEEPKEHLDAVEALLQQVMDGRMRHLGAIAEG